MTAAVLNPATPTDGFRAILGQSADGESPRQMPPCVHVLERNSHVCQYDSLHQGPFKENGNPHSPAVSWQMLLPWL